MESVLYKSKMLYTLWSDVNNVSLLSFKNIFCDGCNKQGMILNGKEIIDCTCKCNIWRTEVKCFCGRPLLIHKLVNLNVIVYCSTCPITF